MECSQLVVEFRFHLLRVQPCAIYYRPVYTKTFRNATILCRHWPRWYSKIVSRLYVRLIEVLNTWQYLLTHWLKILGGWWFCLCLFVCIFAKKNFFFLGMGGRVLGWGSVVALTSVYLLFKCQNDMMLATFFSSCRSVAANVKSDDNRIAFAAWKYAASGSARFRLIFPSAAVEIVIILLYYYY